MFGKLAVFQSIFNELNGGGFGAKVITSGDAEILAFTVIIATNYDIDVFHGANYADLL
jgi:hypothetical protein